MFIPKKKPTAKDVGLPDHYRLTGLLPSTVGPNYVAMFESTTDEYVVIVERIGVKFVRQAPDHYRKRAYKAFCKLVMLGV